ncbi:hypothetical protein AVEN_153622-1 [Araneus ventricosus]|uniref:Uncharacterized protein n=1 Tax=Araneus ventricosus TaxID=182803 RepID=A0A4Y2BNT1_ARAVE|nr:hypothetical protein AVEN_153622-1 [Araneus ventricosus]
MFHMKANIVSYHLKSQDGMFRSGGKCNFGNVGNLPQNAALVIKSSSCDTTAYQMFQIPLKPKIAWIVVWVSVRPHLTIISADDTFFCKMYLQNVLKHNMQCVEDTRLA